MRHSQRAIEGYLQIDHRESPGVTVDQIAPRLDAPIVGQGINFESATLRCSQCHRIVVLNPLRTRERNYCPKCHEYHCDGCTATNPYGHCLPLTAVFDRLRREAELLVKGSDDGEVVSHTE